MAATFRIIIMHCLLMVAVCFPSSAWAGRKFLDILERARIPVVSPLYGSEAEIPTILVPGL